MDKLKSIIGLIVSVATPETIQIGKAIIGSLAAFGRILKDDGTPATQADVDAVWDEALANLATLKSERQTSQARVAADIAAGR